MRDVADLLKEEYPSDKPRYFHGFDISDAQFPADRGSFEYSVQDCLKPFPAEHHNRYDLVHVRLLVSGLKEVDYKKVVANLVPLLSKYEITLLQLSISFLGLYFFFSRFCRTAY
jgi:hypothetical protein